jgi:hypothetical protein
VREELRRVFDLIDPMPNVIATPTATNWDRFEELPELAGTRNQGTPTLCFRREDTFVQVEIGATLVGIVTPVAEIEVRWPAGAIRPPVDERGLFEAKGVPAGPVRLVIDGAVTDWFVR